MQIRIPPNQNQDSQTPPNLQIPPNQKKIFFHFTAMKNKQPMKSIPLWMVVVLSLLQFKSILDFFKF